LRSNPSAIATPAVGCGVREKWSKRLPRVFVNTAPTLDTLPKPTKRPNPCTYLAVEPVSETVSSTVNSTLGTCASTPASAMITDHLKRGIYNGRKIKICVHTPRISINQSLVGPRQPRRSVVGPNRVDEAIGRRSEHCSHGHGYTNESCDSWQQNQQTCSHMPRLHNIACGVRQPRKDKTRLTHQSEKLWARFAKCDTLGACSSPRG
jgi:hypothetical protein